MARGAGPWQRGSGSEPSLGRRRGGALRGSDSAPSFSRCRDDVASTQWQRAELRPQLRQLIPLFSGCVFVGWSYNVAREHVNITYRRARCVIR